MSFPKADFKRVDTFPKRRALASQNTLFAVFILAHIPLGLLLHIIPQLALIHVAATLGIGLIWALGAFPLGRVMYVAAYVVGTEVLWRMVEAPIFWESGKYAVIALFLLGMFRARIRKIPVLPLFFFVMLLPSLPLSLTSPDLTALREQISFNLSGALTLLVSAWFMSNLTLDLRQVRWMLIALVAPIVSIITVTGYTLLTATQITWIEESSFLASGGFGPNQVSAIIGLGLLAIWLLLLYYKFHGLFRVGLVGLGIWLLIQGLLTFSRGGIINAAIPGAIITLQRMRSRADRVVIAFVLIVGIIMFFFVLVPQLNELTGGAFSRRFSDLDPTNREVIARADLEVFLANPLAGVGPGNSISYRQSVLNMRVAAHTEYTRLLSEHGILGLAAIIGLFVAVGREIIRSKPRTLHRDFIIAMSLWGFLFMGHSAMRIAAPSFTIGLAFLTLIDPPPAPSEMP